MRKDEPNQKNTRYKLEGEKGDRSVHLLDLCRKIPNQTDKEDTVQKENRRLLALARYRDEFGEGASYKQPRTYLGKKPPEVFFIGAILILSWLVFIWAFLH